MTGQSLITSMASRYSMDPAQFARTVRATVMPSQHTEEEFAAFMMIAHQYGLNPITREIYAYPGRKGGGINPVVSIDGWINLVNSHPQSDGFEVSFVEGKEGKPVSATCIMWRKDKSHPTTVTEYYAECYRATEPWNGMPHRMLRHKAFKECARLCFGFAGIQDEDEARDISRPVDKFLQREIPAATIKALDDFAADSVDVVEESVGDRPENAGATGSGEAPTSPQPPSAAATSDLRATCIERAMEIATDRNLDEEDRQAELEIFRGVWLEEGKLPDQPDFVRQVFDFAGKVARKEQTESKARFFLSTLVKG